MGIRQLRTLVAVADTGSFSAAAEALRVTQSAVSLQMKSLEAEWAVELFERSRRPPVLNPCGWHLVRHARALVAQYDALRRPDALAAPALVGHVRVGVIPTAATDLLPPALVRLRQAHPGLTVRAESGLSPELVARVAQGRVEAAIVTAPERIDAGLAARLVRTEALRLHVHRELAAGDVAATLAQVPFIRFSRGMGIGRIIDQALQDRDIAVDAVAELDSVEAILRMVGLKLGAAILPDAAPAGDPALVRLALSPPVVRQVVLVARREQAGSPWLQALFEALGDAVGGA